MTTTILDQLTAIEQKEGVRILYACESGSRAWGFASPDSDYDVRFIYVQPRNNYLSIHLQRDVIELPVDSSLDINGWDIRKALQLFLKTNAPLYEWLQSPIVYKEPNAFARELRALMPTFFSLRSGCHHYLAMAYNAMTNDLSADAVKLKKYFYALRPALACGWVLEKRTVPPMEFRALRTLVTDPHWNDAVNRLLEQKTHSDEKTLISPVPVLQDWLAATLPRYKAEADAILAVKHEPERLDALFRKYIDPS